MDTTAEIYTVVAALQPGSLGRRSLQTEPSPCVTCGQAERVAIRYLELSLDAWTPCDFLSVNTTFAVTLALRDRFLAAAVLGAALRPMSVSRSDIFELNDPDLEEQLPDLVQLDIEALVPGPSGWWKSIGQCTACGRPLWEGDAGTSAALASMPGRPKGPPRLVNRKDWNGEDFFWTSDPGPPLISHRVKVLLETCQIPELVLQPGLLV